MMKVIAEEHVKGSMDSEEKESVEGSVKEKNRWRGKGKGIEEGRNEKEGNVKESMEDRRQCRKKSERKQKKGRVEESVEVRNFGRKCRSK